MVEHGQPGAGRDRGQHPLDDILRPGRWEGERHGHHPGAGGLGRDGQHVAAGVVLVVGRQQLVSGSEGEPADDGVHAGRGVVHERQVVRVGADERAERDPGRVEEPFEVLGEERHRFRLHPLPDGALRLEDGGRCRPERAVVQELDGRVERPEGAELRRHAAAIVAPWTRPPARLSRPRSGDLRPRRDAGGHRPDPHRGMVGDLCRVRRAGRARPRRVPHRLRREVAGRAGGRRARAARSPRSRRRKSTGARARSTAT